MVGNIIVSCCPIAWSSCPVSVNKMSQAYFICVNFDGANWHMQI